MKILLMGCNNYTACFAARYAPREQIRRSNNPDSIHGVKNTIIVLGDKVVGMNDLINDCIQLTRLKDDYVWIFWAEGWDCSGSEREFSTWEDFEQTVTYLKRVEGILECP